MSKVLIPLAHGCEELEAVTVIDLLRRAELTVTVAGLEAGAVTASRGVVMVPDTTLEQVLDDDFALIVLPGGLGGMQRLEADARITKLLRRMNEQGRYIAAICAAPQVLVSAGLVQGKEVTAYPGVLNAQSGVKLSNAAVVQDGIFITSRGPGTAMDFALSLIELLRGKNVRDSVEASLQRDAATLLPA